MIIKSPDGDFLESCRARFLITGRRRRVTTAVIKTLGVDYNNFRRTIAPTVYFLRSEETGSRSIIFLITITGSAVGDIRSIVKARSFKSDGRRSNGDGILGEGGSYKINKKYDSRTSRSI